MRNFEKMRKHEMWKTRPAHNENEIHVGIVAIRRKHGNRSICKTQTKIFDVVCSIIRFRKFSLFPFFHILSIFEFGFEKSSVLAVRSVFFFPKNTKRRKRGQRGQRGHRVPAYMSIFGLNVHVVHVFVGLYFWGKKTLPTASTDCFSIQNSKIDKMRKNEKVEILKKGNTNEARGDELH